MRRATSASSAAFWSCSQSRACFASSWVCTRASTTVGHDRLGDVVGGAELEAALLVAGVGQRGEEDHGNVARAGVFLDATPALHSRPCPASSRRAGFRANGLQTLPRRINNPVCHSTSSRIKRCVCKYWSLRNQPLNFPNGYRFFVGRRDLRDRRSCSTARNRPVKLGFTRLFPPLSIRLVGGGLLRGAGNCGKIRRFPWSKRLFGACCSASPRTFSVGFIRPVRPPFCISLFF
jgi:hypothetical protein